MIIVGPLTLMRPLIFSVCHPLYCVKRLSLGSLEGRNPVNAGCFLKTTLPLIYARYTLMLGKRRRVDRERRLFNVTL